MSEIITGEVYDLPDSIREGMRDVRVEYVDEHQHTIAGQEAQQRDVVVIDSSRDTEISVTETMSPIGTLESARGDIGLAAAYLCTMAEGLGVPTLCYTDERIKIGNLDERYHDLSAEWYHDAAVDAGIIEGRKHQHSERYDAVAMEVGELEDLAMKYIDR